jgi:hypothetical protein
MRAEKRCELRPKQLMEGVTVDQEKELKKRKKNNAEQSEEEKWKDVYRILFPDAKTIPTPCKSAKEAIICIFSVANGMSRL